MNGNPNYEEREDGIWKKDTSTVKGNANYFSKIPPPCGSTAFHKKMDTLICSFGKRS